jgi:hypothetical protein
MRLNQLDPMALADLSKLLSCPDDYFEAAFELLNNIQPTSEASTLISIAPSDSVVPSSDLEKFANALGYIYYVFMNLLDRPMSAGEFTQQLLLQMAQRTGFQANEERLVEFKSKFCKFLGGGDGFGVSVKANDLVTQNDNNYARSRIISDLRPLFLNDDEIEKPSAFVIVHTLRLGYVTGPTSEKQFSMSMDTGELYELRDTIERAIQKAKYLSDFVATTDASLIEADLAKHQPKEQS